MYHRDFLWVWCFTVVMAACTRPNPEFCCTLTSDCETFGVSNPRACDSGFVCMNNACIAAQCTRDSECSGATPLCDTTTGTCAGCLTGSDCPSTAPVCDQATLMCRQCGSNSDCASEVCDPDAGTCIDSSEVLYASTDGSGIACSLGVPCAIATAVATVNTVQDVVLIEPGIYPVPIDIVSGTEVLVSGYGATLTGLDASNNVMTIPGATKARILGLNMLATGSALSGISINLDQDPPADVSIEDVTIDSVGIGLDAIATNLTLARSHVHSSGEFALASVGGGSAIVDRIRIDGAGITVAFTSRLSMTNSIIGPMLPSNAPFFIGGAAVSIAFSTIYDSPIACGSAAPDCTSGSGAGICFDSTLIFSDLDTGADTMTGTACTSSYTLVYPQSTPIAGSNNLLGENPLLVAPGSGNFHLQPSSPAIGAADPTATDTHDFDGTPRPAGFRGDIGAFEHSP
jgi:hypothetical protein